MKVACMVIIILAVSFFNWSFGQKSINAKEPVWLKKSIKMEVLMSHEPLPHNYTIKPECFIRAMICEY